MIRGWDVLTVETEKRRWAILAHLHGTPGYELNDDILLMGARAQGIPSSAEQMRAALHWLHEQQLVELREIGSLLIATLTGAGDDVARGYRVVPGIQRPRPVR